MLVMRDVGSLLKVVWSAEPDELAAGAVNGAAIDRQGLLSAVLAVRVGDVEGTPTSFTVDAKLQDSATSGGTYADIVGAAITQIVAATTSAFKDVDLSGAKRFIRVVVTVAFVGGTSPNAAVAAPIVLGGADVLPQA